MEEFSSVERAIETFRDGGIVIVVDDEDRENEGDMVLAAERVTPEKINFLSRHARGLVCMPITEERAGQLELPLMVPRNTCRYNTAFTVSIDLISAETSTGISAFDRAATVRAVVDRSTPPDAFA
jgi:3,4-dihydroxy 2-butanone 4-phosphate synthase/GTP cyclohydrolase II